MSKRIESIEDLADIAGAELGTKQAKSKIEKAVAADTPKSPAPKKPIKPAKPTKPSKPAKPAKPSKPAKPTKDIEIKRTDTAIDPDSGPRNGDIVKGKVVDHLTNMYNAFEVGYIEHYPCIRTMLADIRSRPNPINNHTRTYKKKDLPRLIKEELIMSKRFREIYENGLARGENNIGYVSASIFAEREHCRLEAYLAELTEKS